jgi:hypothetical protein
VDLVATQARIANERDKKREVNVFFSCWAWAISCLSIPMNGIHYSKAQES